MFSKQIKNISSLLVLSGLALFLSVCSSGRAVSDYQKFLTNDAAKSQSTSMKVKIPAGWFTAVDNENKLIDLWLIKDDYSAMLNFAVINIDAAAIKEAGGYPLAAAVKFSKKFKQAASKKELAILGEDEFFELGKNTVGTYKYRNGSGAVVRVALINYKDKIYELTASPAPKTDVKLFNSEELFLIQDAVLSSVE